MLVRSVTQLCGFPLFVKQTYLLHIVLETVAVESSIKGSATLYAGGNWGDSCEHSSNINNLYITVCSQQDMTGDVFQGN